MRCENALAIHEQFRELMLRRRGARFRTPPCLHFRGEHLTLPCCPVHVRNLAQLWHLALQLHQFKSSRDIGHYGGAALLFDADTGAFRELRLQHLQKVGPWLTDWPYALHFGSVWGLPMQIFICVMGIVVATLSVTGVVVWWRKRQARAAAASKRPRTQVLESRSTSVRR